MCGCQTRWSGRGRILSSFLAAFRPLFRLSMRWSAPIPTEAIRAAKNISAARTGGIPVAPVQGCSHAQLPFAL
jgi:hypothetical protein